MERFVIIVNGFQQLTIITKHSIFDVVAAIDPPLPTSFHRQIFITFADNIGLINY